MAPHSPVLLAAVAEELVAWSEAAVVAVATLSEAVLEWGLVCGSAGDEGEAEVRVPRTLVPPAVAAAGRAAVVAGVTGQGVGVGEEEAASLVRHNIPALPSVVGSAAGYWVWELVVGEEGVVVAAELDVVAA